jgi:hypothetical protein
LLIIQASIRGEFIPLLFCLLPKKNFNCYYFLFNLIKVQFKVNQPKYIVIDFEAGLFLSLKAVFRKLF